MSTRWEKEQNLDFILRTLFPSLFPLSLSHRKRERGREGDSYYKRRLNESGNSLCQSSSLAVQFAVQFVEIDPKNQFSVSSTAFLACCHWKNLLFQDFGVGSKLIYFFCCQGHLGCSGQSLHRQVCVFATPASPFVSVIGPLTITR